MDALLANSNDLASATRVILLEIKSSTSNSVPFSVSLGSGYGGYQLDGNWLTGVINKIAGNNEINKTIQVVGQTLRTIYRDTPDKIEKYIIQVDSNASAKILRIE